VIAYGESRKSTIEAGVFIIKMLRVKLNYECPSIEGHS
jgi:hypothetical protein